MAILSPELHAIFGGLLRERLGLHYGTDDRDLLADRLELRARDAGFESLLDYYYHLRYDDGDGAELAALADTLVVNESYFFRELDALLVLVDDVIAPAIGRGERPRVWSAACAGGEEPLTLAMLLDSRGLLEATDLQASDLSHAALDRAQRGTWSRRAVRTVPPHATALASRYLRVDERRVDIEPRLREAITWRRLNLVDRDQVGAMPPCDAILCRNVLIYFDDDTVRRVVGSLAGRLRPGGTLFVGVSESLMRFGTSLACEERGGVFLYRRSR